MVKNTKIFSYGKQFIDEDDIAAVVDALGSEYLTQGPRIDAFEQEFAAVVGAKYCVAVNSGTAALHAAYFACGLQEGDEIITTPLTFAATSNAALYLGARVRFADIDPQTGNIDCDLVAKAVTPKTKLIAPVHYAGQPADLEKLSEFRKAGVKIVEDACHALGATYKGKSIGSCQFSDAAVFSFHPVKHITMGEGGAITTNDATIYQSLLKFRTHGITKDPALMEDKNQGEWYYEMQTLGFNYRITDFQAALGSSQLEKLPSFLKQRNRIAGWYRMAFKDSKYFDIPPVVSGTTHAFHLYPIRLKDRFLSQRKEIFSALRAAGLGVQVHYVPVYAHPYYRSHGFATTRLPIAESFYGREISIPMYPGMTKTDVLEVIDRIKKVFNEWK